MRIRLAVPSLAPCASWLCLAAALLAGCRGSVRLFAAQPPALPVYIEVEPNDWAPDADFIAPLTVPAQLLVRGDLQAEFGDVDGFAFRATQALTVEFALDPDDPHADLDLCLYDPWLDEIVECYRSPGGEKGRFHVLQPARDFHLVVFTSILDCGSSYDLSLSVLPLALEPGARGEPGGTAAVPAPAGADASRQVPRQISGYAERAADARGRRDDAEPPPGTRARPMARVLSLSWERAGEAPRIVEGVLLAAGG